MSETLRLALTLAVGVVASWTDVRKGVIPDRLTLPAAAAGLVAGAMCGGLAGFRDALLGGLAGLLLGLAFLLLGYGAGDAKLSMAFGTLLGGEGILRTTVCCVLIEGLAALSVLVTRRQLSRSLSALAAWGTVVLSGVKARPLALGTLPHAPCLTAGAVLAVMLG